MAEYRYYWRYGLIDQWIEYLLYKIGSSSTLTYADIEPHTDGNSVYVSWSGGDDTDHDGTYDSPYRTLQYAKSMLQTGQYIITILDSNYYYTADSTHLYLDIDGIVVQGAEGCSPTLTVDTAIASQPYLCTISNSGKLINVLMQGSLLYAGYSGGFRGALINSGTVKYVEFKDFTKYAVYKETSGTGYVYYSKICNSGLSVDGSSGGFGIIHNTGNLELRHCQITGNYNSGILGNTNSNVRSLIIDHCTIAKNVYGLYTYGTTNLSVTITNSIIYKNHEYDVYGSYGTFTYSCIGSVQGSPTITDCLRVNPLFVSNEDFRLRSKYNGFGDTLLLSPCIGRSNTGGDLGCYEYSRVLSSQEYVEFNTGVPSSVSYNKVAIDSKLITVSSMKSRILLRGIVNRLDLKWSGTDNVLSLTEATNLEKMFEADGEIYLSVDNGATFTKYVIDKTRGFSTDRGLNTLSNTYRTDAGLSLYEV